ncbi:MAG: redoxin domain-containing protein [Nitrospiraceae bacterium]|nr:redoxin domain-containing protein [Nitrospiraceae bacterium]
MSRGGGFLNRRPGNSKSERKKMNGKLMAMMALAGGMILLGSTDRTAWSMGERVPAAGMPAAEFTLTDLEGRQQSLSQYRGKVVLLNFWATWCKPCTTEMPAMQATFDKLRGKGFVVLAVNELEDDEKVRAHIRDYKHTFPVLMDRENRVANLYGVYGLPVSVFIDEAGVVQAYIKGGLLTEQKIEDEIARIRSVKPIQAAAR